VASPKDHAAAASAREYAIMRSFDFRRANASRRIFVAASIPETHIDVMRRAGLSHAALIGEDRTRD
jgi:hypothetical protein